LANFKVPKEVAMFRWMRLLGLMLLAGGGGFLISECRRPSTSTQEIVKEWKVTPSPKPEKKAEAIRVSYEPKRKADDEPAPIELKELPIPPIPDFAPPKAVTPITKDIESPEPPVAGIVFLEPPSPQKPKLRYINQPRVAVAFEVTNRGPSGVSASELWATRENQTWRCIARKDGDASPIIARFTEEGVYHLKMVFVAGSGRSSGVPSAGDEPEEWVILDTTLPQASLLGVKAVPNKAGWISIRWQASDTHLEERPIKLEWSADNQRWQSIRDWMTNDGTVAWQPPEGTPPEVYLRLTARDKAGNEAESRTPKPVNIDMVVPMGKVTGVVDFEELPRPRERVE
jgi:hypothetical protein